MVGWLAYVGLVHEVGGFKSHVPLKFEVFFNKNCSPKNHTYGGGGRASRGRGTIREEGESGSQRGGGYRIVIL